MRTATLVFSSLVALGLSLAPSARPVEAQANASIVFVSRRPPRELSTNIRGWAMQNRVVTLAEDTEAHVWRVQLMAFCNREPRAAEVNLVFYKLEGRTRRYISSEPVALSAPNERIFFHNTVLHRGVGEFEPQNEYEVAITVGDSRGNNEIARGRINLTGPVERHSGVVDFTGSAPVLR
ncbi:MAG: hypothetical protein JNK72_16510 [Myxococcales bacterium]|nr:hypothetical protein [Myxococcales bacterium]